jgi:hydrogenase maturation factor
MTKKTGKRKLLQPGKLPHDLLDKMLAELGPLMKDPDVIVGPEVGVDAAVIKTTGKYLAVTCDPITLAGDLAAYYCVHVNANDLAVTGAIPKFMTVVGLIPPVSSEEIEQIGKDLGQAVRPLNITIIGGHTEITNTVNQPILVATMIGLLPGGKRISADGAKPGDVVIMTKTVALEASAIMAREKTEVLQANGFTDREIRRMQNLLFKPGISVLPEAKLSAAAGCSAMHDATEGGLLTALWELAYASKTKIEIDTRVIPVLPETRRACNIWKMDPLRAISSGTLLITIPARKAEKLMTQLKESKIQATIIGKVQAGKPTLVDETLQTTFGPSEDEISKIYA